MDLRAHAAGHSGRSIACAIARRARALANNRLAQFVVLGTAIFAASRTHVGPNEIIIDSAELRALVAAASDGSGAPKLSERAVRDIEQRAIEDELLYREGLRRGLDVGDPIVRQRVIQKTLFVAEELDGATRPPTEAELRAYHAAHGDRWRRPARYRIAHLFAHRREDLEGDPTRLVGEPGPLPREIEIDDTQLRLRVGAAFAEVLAGLPTGRWTEPFTSAFGFHRVELLDRWSGDVAPYEEVRTEVAEVFTVARREAAVGSFLRKAFAEYRVVVDGRVLGDIEPAKRVAFRSEGSAED